MTNLTKAFKILWMKNRLWVLIFMVFALLIGVSNINSSIYSTKYDFTTINIVNLLYESGLNKNSQGIPEKSTQIINQAYEMRNDNYNRKYSEEYLTETYIKYQEILDRFYIEEVEDVYIDPETSEQVPLNYLQPLSDNPEEYESFLYELERFAEFIENHTLVDKNNDVKYKVNFQQGNKIHVIGFILILSMILTSAEHLTSYYEFTRMLPWKQEETFIYKILYGCLFIFLLMIISFIFEYIMWKNSIYGNIISGYISSDLLLSILVSLAVFFIAMGTGSLAGNILGHIGLMIIAFFGISLIDINLTVLANIFNTTRGESVMGNLSMDLPDFVLGFLDPVFGHMKSQTVTNGLIYGMFALGIVYLIIGLYFSKNAYVSKSKMLVMNKPIALLAKFLAIVSSAALITVMANVFFVDHSIILGLLVYIIGLIISYKFYDKLFKVQLGA